MKKYILILILMLMCLVVQNSYAQLTYLYEDFDNLSDTTEDKTPPVLPLGWTSTIENGSQDWRFRYGGYTTITIRHPRTPKSGRRNALFQIQHDFDKAKLITPSLDLSTATKPVLKFYIAQDAWFGNVDYLNVYYKKSSGGSWALIQSFTTQKIDWVWDSIQLEDAWLSNDFYIAFEGLSNFGWGVCLDSIVIEDSYITPRTLNSVTVSQASTAIVPQGYPFAPILRVDFKVAGNVDSVFLTSFSVNRSGTDVNNLISNGVSIFWTKDPIFTPDQQLKTSIDFTGDVATFSGLHVSLPSGKSSVWVTYSVKPTATIDATLSAKIEANQIITDQGSWPTTTQDPGTSRKIAATIYHEDFEAASGWALSNEFEINSTVVYSPVGMYGYPHPVNAFSGTKVLGTDLSGLGATPGFYEKNLASDEYSATSPVFDAQYYKDLSIIYQRCLNVKDADSANFYAYDGSNWLKLWYSGQQLTTIADNGWRSVEHNLSDLDRNSNSKVWFSLGPTNNMAQMSGWTIDDIFVTGREVNYDIAPTLVTSPVTACGMTTAETVTATFTNKGKLALTGSIPVRYTVNGLNPVNEVMAIGTLNSGASISYSFTQKLNMTDPKNYAIKVEALMISPADDYTKNDTLTKNVRSMLTITPDPESLSDFDNQSNQDWYTDGVPLTSWINMFPSGYNVINYLPPPAGNDFVWMTIRNNGEEDSYVESPCFNLSATEKPVITFHCFTNVDQPGNCGVILKYSVDGTNWSYLPLDAGSPSGWYWYDTTVALLGGQEGFSNKTQTEWKIARQFVPAGLAGSPTVKFRVEYAGTQDEAGDGFAFDNFRVMEAPHDIGVTATSIATACETKNPLPVTVTVKNFGYRDVKSGDTVILAVKVNSSAPIYDSIELASDLTIGSSVVLNFSKTVSVNLPATYDITVYTVGEKEPTFYGANNDTLEKTITTNPLPPLAMADSIMSRTPHMLTLHAGLSPIGDYSYSWYDNKGCSGCVTTEGYQNATAWKGYTGWVQATNIATGCFAWDTTKVVLLFNDLSMKSIIKPVASGCDTVKIYPQVVLQHTGNDTLKAGVDSVQIIYQFKTDPLVKEMYHFTQNFKRGDTLLYTFATQINMNQFNQSYFFGAAVHFLGDTVPANDSLDATVWIYQPPTVSLGYDSMTYYGILFPMEISSIPGVVDYTWTDLQTMADTSGPLDTTYAAQTWGYHKITVTDNHGCVDSDSAYVKLFIYDVSPTLIEPFTSCSHATDELVIIKVTNTGTDTIAQDDVITFAYRINSGTWRNATKTLTARMFPDSSIKDTFLIPENLSAVTSFNFDVVGTIIGKDIKNYNDTIQTVITTHGFPAVDLCSGYTCVPGSPRVLSYIGATFNFDAGSNPDYTYSWSFGATPISTASSVVVSQKGTYTVYVTDTTTGCTKADDVYLNLIIPDVSISSISIDDSVCKKDAGNLILELTNTGNTNITDTLYFKYKLNTTDSVLAYIKPASALGPGSKSSYTFTGLGSKVSLSMVNQFDLFVNVKNDVKPYNNDSTVMVSVFQDPDSFDIGKNFVVVNDSIKRTIGENIQLDPGLSGYTYLWNTGGTGSTLSVTTSGWYKLTVSNTYGCTRADSVYVLFQPNSIISITDKDNRLEIFPNPAHIDLNLLFQNATGEDVNLEILSLDGKVIYNKMILADQKEFYEKLNVARFAKGMYLIRIYNSSFIKMGKVFVE